LLDKVQCQKVGVNVESEEKGREVGAGGPQMGGRERPLSEDRPRRANENIQNSKESSRVRKNWEIKNGTGWRGERGEIFQWEKMRV